MSFHFTTTHHIEHYVHLLTACSRVCQNEGTLDEGTCMCSCVGGFSGANCESECNVKKLFGMTFIIIVVDLGTCNPPKSCKLEINRNSYITLNDHPLILSHFITIKLLACTLTCQNGGTLNETTCTCACADGYSGDTCGSECTARVHKGMGMQA